MNRYIHIYIYICLAHTDVILVARSPCMLKHLMNELRVCLREKMRSGGPHTYVQDRAVPVHCCRAAEWAPPSDAAERGRSSLVHGSATHEI